MSIYLLIFWMFFRIGLFGFGGGYAILPLIFQSVQQFGIMTHEEFADLTAISQITPGPIALNAAIFTGINAAGIPGAVVAMLAITLPSLILVSIVVRFLDRFKESAAISAAMGGIRPATIGLIASAAIFIGAPSLFNGGFDIKSLSEMGIHYFNLAPVIIFFCCILLNGKWKVHPLILVALGGAAGAFLA